MGKARIIGYIALCLVTVLAGTTLGAWFGYRAGAMALSEAQPAPQATQPSAGQDSAEQPPIKTQPGASREGVTAVVEKCAKSVVNITIEAYETGYTGGNNVSKKVLGHGTGVIVRENGYIVTCHHVIDGADVITVTLEDKTELTAEVVGSDELFDLAVIRVKANNLPAVKLGSSEKAVAGEQVVVIGNPLGEFGFSVSAGVLSAPTRELTIAGVPLRLMQTDAAVNPGNSGGALFNGNGELIGIVNAKVSASGIEGIGFAIPVDTIWHKVEGFISGTVATGKALLGIGTQNATYYLDGKQINCLEITSVREDGPAELAGLQKGDYLIRAQGKTLQENDDLTVLIKYCSPGDKITFELYRNKEKITLTVTLGTAEE